MTSLTTRQRDLLHVLFGATAPLTTADVAKQLHLTSRQVNYSLKGMQSWLSQYDVSLEVTPGVGVQLVGSTAQHKLLQQLLHSDTGYQLVLSPHQRQQLLIFQLLTVDEPLILYQLQQLTQVSRSTILKDLDSAESWLQSFDLQIKRRPNYGIKIADSEKAKRQALVALLWGDTSFTDPLWKISLTGGLEFELSNDASLLPILEHAQAIIKQIAAQQAIDTVAQAEAELGGRFSDLAVLHLTLVIAIQRWRIQQGHFLQNTPEALDYLQNHLAWGTASRIYAKLTSRQQKKRCEPEVAFLTAYLLASARNERWPGDLEGEGNFASLLTQLLTTISSAYRLPDLLQDTTLRDGLIAHVIPACIRQRFNLWSPPQSSNRLQATYGFELDLADKLGQIIHKQTGANLPPHEINNLAMLIRAAYVRERPNRLQRVIVVCPSGMATAQLLTARLKARFPRLGTMEVLSMRELSVSKLASAELILTTVPLPPKTYDIIKVIQVHPLLLPEDIETITQWLA